MQNRRCRRKIRRWVHATTVFLVGGIALRVFLWGVAVYGASAHACGCSDGVCCCHPTSSVPRLEPCRWKNYLEAGSLLTPGLEPSLFLGFPEPPALFGGGVGIFRPSFANPPDLPEPPPRPYA